MPQEWRPFCKVCFPELWWILVLHTHATQQTSFKWKIRSLQLKILVGEQHKFLPRGFVIPFLSTTKTHSLFWMYSWTSCIDRRAREKSCYVETGQELKSQSFSMQNSTPGFYPCFLNYSSNFCKMPVHCHYCEVEALPDLLQITQPFPTRSQLSS